MDEVDGTPFGRYRLIELLGRGGMGEVWRAYDTETKRIVAIKVLPSHLADDSDFVRRFRREAESAAQLNSPHVIPIHHYGEIDGRLYVDMRVVEGRDLHTVLTEGPLNPARAVHIIGQVAKALHVAHKAGLLHRDIKPSNILLDDDDFAYLIDFGIARALDDTRMTKTGSAIGTYNYIAPERLTIGTDEDARVDIYSLACVLYECLTGSPPFPGDTVPQLVGAHLYAAPPQPSTTQPDVPLAVDEVIATGMAKDPNQRYATTIELADAAHHAITAPIERPAPLPATEPAPGPTLLDDTIRPADRPPPATGAQPRQPWWRRGAIVIPAALLTVAVIAAAVVITSRQHKNSNGPQITLPTSTQHREPAYGPQVTLPFTGLNGPNDVALDSAGNLYVADYVGKRVLELAAGSSRQTVLPFTFLRNPEGVAVDGVGNVYATDNDDYNPRVLKLAPGSSSQTVLLTLPFTGVRNAGRPMWLAADSAGNVYVTDYVESRVLKLAAGSSTPTVLPFTSPITPSGVAVDSTGNLYVSDFHTDRVLRLAVGSSTPTVLPFAGLSAAYGLAADNAGNVYVADGNHNRVLKLAAGSSTPTLVPFTGLNFPTGVAVDSAGNVYVADERNDQVLKLPLQ